MAERTPRRLRWILASIVVLLVLIGGSELALRIIVPNVISGAVREQLQLSDSHPVDVSLGGSALLYALSGRVGQVSVVVDDAELVEGLRGTISLRADSVPFDLEHGDISGGSASLTVNRDELPAAIALLTAGLADSAEVRRGELVVSRTLELFGQEVPISVALALAIDQGDVVIEPRSVTAAGFDLTAEQIRSASGGALDALLSTHEVCVADQIPAGITLTDVQLLSTGSVNLEVAFDPRIISDPEQQELGSCADAR